MASGKQIRDEIMKLTIAVNSDPAQKEIHSLREENNKLNESIDVLKQKKDELGRRNKANAQEWDALTKEIQKSTTEIGRNNKKIEELRASMDITQMTVGQLKKELALLNQQKINVLPGSEAAQKLNEQIGAINTRLREVSGGASESRRSFSSLADKFNHYSGLITAGAAALVGFGITVQNIIDRNNKMADAMSGVEKTTGMARQEVEQLTKSFADFDTRTSKLDLLKIAEEGGRLGVAKSQIANFVQEVDKANVALGDSWSGGAAKVAESLGKITTLYDTMKALPIAESINQVGSALNELAADGASSESNIADFVTRVGSMPSSLKPAIGEVMGIGASLEEFGIDAERGATAFSNFMTTAAKETAKFAEVMRVPEQQVKDLINSNPTEFFFKFSEGLKGLDATQLASIFEHLKLNDQYVKSVLGAASDHTERFREQIDLANQSMKEGTSLQIEFDKVNNNAAATWEKLQKKIAGFFTSEFIAKGLDKLITGFSLFVGVNENAHDKLNVFGKTMLTITRVLAVITISMFSLGAAMSVYNLLLKESIAKEIALEGVQKARMVTNQLANTAQVIWNTVVGLGQLGIANLTKAIGVNIGAAGMQIRAINMQTAAQARLNAVTIANPFGLVLTLIGLAVTAYFSYKAVVDDTTKTQKSFNDVMKEGVKNAADETSALDILYKTATNDKLSRGERLKAVQKLQDMYPSYFGNIDKEIIMNGKAAKSYYELRNAIVESARADAARDELKKRQADRLLRDEELQGKINKETKLRNEYKSKQGQTLTKRLNGDDGKGFQVDLKYDDLLSASRERLKELRDIQESYKKADDAEDRFVLNIITDKERKAAKLINDRNKDTQKNSGYKADFGSGEAKSSQPGINRDEKHEEDKWEAILSQRKKDGETAEQLARQIELDIEDAKIEAMAEGFEKELATIEIQHQRKLAQIDKQKIQQSAFDKIDEQIAKATGNDKVFFETLKKSWKDNNDQLEALKESQTDIYISKKLALDAKNGERVRKQEDEIFQQELAIITRNKNERLVELTSLAEQRAFLTDKITKDELAKITTREEGKAAIERYYQQQALQRQVEYLQKRVTEFNVLMSLNPMNALNPEQLKTIEEYKNKIAELLAELDKLKGGVGAGLGTAKEKSIEAGNKSFAEKGKTKDILGMSPDEWNAMFERTENVAQAIGKISAAIDVAKQMFSAYFSYVDANEKRQLQQYEKATVSKKSSLKKQLNEGYINQETYKRLTLQADEELEKKKAEIALKQAKREKQMAIASTLMNTAQAIMGIWAQFPKFDFGATAAIMTGVVGAMGALQVATIMSQPLPSAVGYEEGYNTDYPITRQQDGKRFNVRRRSLRSGLVDRPTHFIAGENGVEMVIDSPTWTTYSPELKSAIYTANAKAKGYEGGFNTVPEKTINLENNDEIMMKIIAVLNQNTAVMKDIKDNGLAAYFVKSARNGKEVQDMLDENQKLINKNKH